MKKRLLFTVFISVLLISTTFTGIAANVRVRKVDNIGKVEHLLRNKALSSSEFSSVDKKILTVKNVDANEISTVVDRDVEYLQMVVDEDISVKKDGTATLVISMTIPSSTLAEMYRDMLGVPSTAEVGKVENIPRRVIKSVGNITIASAGRESFHKSICWEQWLSLGIAAQISDSSMVPFGENNELKVGLHANAFLRLNDFSNGIWSIKFGPSATNDIKNVTRFISALIGYTKLMLISIPGEQIFKRSWTTKINLPENAELLNSEDLEKLYWRLDFGGNTVIESHVKVEKPSTIFLTEEMVVTESETVSPTPVEKYKSFEIKFLSPDFRISYKDIEIPGLDITTFWESDILSWEANLSDVISSDYYDISYYVTCNANFTVHLDLTNAWVKPHFHIEAGFRANFTLPYEYESDPIPIIPPLKWEFTIPYIIPVIIDVTAGPEFKLYFNAEASLTVSASAWVDAWFKAGISYSLSKGFDPIWESGFSKGYTPPILEGYAKVSVKPVVSFPIKAKVYGLIGPKVTPEVYLEGVIMLLSSGKLFWSLKLGFDILVGVCIGVPFFWELYWDWKIFDYAIAEWSNTIQLQDQISPETKLFAYAPPRYPSGGNWYVGPYLFFYLQAIDRGEIPSGLSYTMLKVDNGNWIKYTPPDIVCVTPGGVLGSGYSKHHIYWYSVDNLGNKERTHEWTVLIDLEPPNSWIKVGEPYQDNHVVANQTIITIQGQDENGWRIWYRIWNKKYGWSDWNRGGECEIIRYTFPETLLGKCYIEWYAEDGVWNFEETHNQTFYVERPPKLWVDSEYHDFGIIDVPAQENWVFHIKNIGDGTLTWNIVEDRKWLSIEPTSGSTTSETDDIKVIVSTKGLDYNKHYNTIIRVSSNGGSIDIVIEFDTGESPPKLQISPAELFFKLETGSSDIKVFNIKNSGGKNLQWSVSGWDDISWISSVTPTSGSNSAGKSTSVRVSIVAPDTPNRDYYATLYVVSNGGNKQVSVHLRVMGPELYVSSKAINLRIDPEYATTKTFTIKNVGDGKKTLDWSLSGWEGKNWIDSVSPTSGSIPAGKATTVYLSITAPDDEGNNYVANLRISSNAGSKKIPLHLHVNGPAIMHVVPTDLKFSLDPYKRDESQFLIKNFGEQTLEWYIEKVPDWVISVAPDHGSIAGGKETSVRLNVKAPDQPATDIEGCIAVRSNVGDIAVHIALHVEDLTPDLEVGGYLDLKCKPGELVTGSFKVRNAGKEGSLLDWRIVSWPEWGSNWSFDQMQGYSLRPSDGDIEVKFSFNAPDRKDYFEGNIWLENMHDGNDFAFVYIRLSTPKDFLRYSGLRKVVFGYFPVYQKLFKSLNCYNYRIYCVRGSLSL